MLFPIQELYFCFFARGFGMRFARPLTVTSVLKTEFFIPISADGKGATSGFRVLANHLASFFFLTLSCDSFGLLSWPLHPLLYPIRSQSVNISWLSFWPGLVTSAARNWPTFLIPLLTVSLWGLLIQTWRGRGNFLFLCSQWQTTWHSWLFCKSYSIKIRFLWSFHVMVSLVILWLCCLHSLSDVNTFRSDYFLYVSLFFIFCEMIIIM